MRTALSVRPVHRLNMRVDVHVRNQVLLIDYPAPSCTYSTLLEVLLSSLAAGADNTLNLVLSKKMGAQMDSIEVDSKERLDEHLTTF